MCPLSPHESPSGSVMTRRSGGRVQRSRNLSQPQQQHSSVPESSRATSLDVGVANSLSPESAVAGVLSKRDRRFACSCLRYRGLHWIDVLTQVGKLRMQCLLIFFLVLSLHSQSVMCQSWHTEHPKHITFKSKLCRPVSPEDLQTRMANSFDERKMARDGTSARKQFGDTQGYQGDDPFAGIDLDDLDMLDKEALLSSSDMWLREEEVYEDGRLYDGLLKEEGDLEFDLNVEAEEEEEEEEEEDGDEEGEEDNGEGEWNKEKSDNDGRERRHRLRRTWLPRRRILGTHRRDEGRYGVADVRFGKGETNSNTNNNLDSYNNYMRRRRRRRRSAVLDTDPKGSRLRAQSTRQKDNDKSREKALGDKISNSISSKKSSDVHLALQFLLSGKRRNNRKLRKQLKKEIRQRTRKLNKPPPWQCKFKRRIVFMDEGIFPRVLNDGRCVTDKCFYRLYNCEPIKYAIKLLKRDPDRCNPLPLKGNGTVYEERWNLLSHHITVGCNCASIAESNRSKGRRKY